MDPDSIDQPATDSVVPRVADKRLRLLVGCFIALVACGQISAILAPRLVNHYPSLLLALSSRIRHLLFTSAAGINPVAYSLIGFARIFVAAWLCYVLGYFYGDRGFRWLEAQSGGKPPATLTWLQRAADRAGWLIVVLMPGSNLVCALVGQRRMPRRTFGACISIGIAFRLTWVWIAAQHFKPELERALKWIEKYQWWLVIGFLGLSFVQSAFKASRNGSGDTSL